MVAGCSRCLIQNKITRLYEKFEDLVIGSGAAYDIGGM